MMLRWLLEAPGTPQGPELRLVQGRGAEGLEATRAAGAQEAPKTPWKGHKTRLHRDRDIIYYSHSTYDT